MAPDAVLVVIAPPGVLMVLLLLEKCRTTGLVHCRVVDGCQQAASDREVHADERMRAMRRFIGGRAFRLVGRDNDGRQTEILWLVFGAE